MACKCSPSLVRLMADFAKLGHVNSGCCGDAAHQARKSDHNPDASGYAHAQDIHEKNDHDMQPFVDFIMANPRLFPQIKYLIYEGHIYYPHNGARRAGKYVYTGPNSHAHHLHVSINADATTYAGTWHVVEAYQSPQPSEEENMENLAYIATLVSGPHAGAVLCVHQDAVFWIATVATVKSYLAAGCKSVEWDGQTFEQAKAGLNYDVLNSPVQPA